MAFLSGNREIESFHTYSRLIIQDLVSITVIGMLISIARMMKIGIRSGLFSNTLYIQVCLAKGKFKWISGGGKCENDSCYINLITDIL